MSYFIIIFLAAVTGLVLQVVSARQYNVEEEAIRLYGEDLSTVLKRFRKTPEYATILQQRVNEMMENLNDIVINVKNTYGDRVLGKYINVTLETQGALPKRRRFRGIVPPLFMRNRRKKSPVAKIDAHPSLHSPLSVTERNMFRNLGYNVSRLAIQQIIHGMEPQEDLGKQYEIMPFDMRTTNTPQML